eukprot:SAG31_NODE_1508_length_8063_cov_3.156956_8_plen_142_part_00
MRLRLAAGRSSCVVGCNCSTPTACQLDGTCGMPSRYLPHPPAPPPTPPAPPGPMPKPPTGFHAVAQPTTGSCRDGSLREPPFYSGHAINVTDCLDTCAEDPSCTAAAYCTEKCSGACHIYTTSKTVRRRFANFRIVARSIV